MIVFYKTSDHKIKLFKQSGEVRGNGRIKKINKVISKSNKEFLQALGFKIK